MKKRVSPFLVLCLSLCLLGTSCKAEPKLNILMAWDLILRPEDNFSLARRIPHEGVNVLAPTWFSIEWPAGEVSSLADKEYVSWAHEQGIFVWAVLENRSDDELTLATLSSKDSRDQVTSHILKLAADYALDGINLDFENMTPESAAHFRDFMEELYPQLREMGIVLSVDIPLDPEWIDELIGLSFLSENSDYVVLMGYDQHYSADDPGPVSSAAWLRQGAREMLLSIPAERAILGLPFYSRIWIEEDGKETRAYTQGMREAYETFETIADIWERDAESGLIYSEHEDGSRRYRVWLEDKHSLQMKLDIIDELGLKGMSAWYRGLEWPDTWPMIREYFFG